MREGDTIAAIATPWGEGGIAIVRLSGPQAIEIADKVFKGKRKSLKNMPTYTMAYGHIVNPSTGEEIDEVIVSLMRAPYSYTREDVVEINCHGGTLVASRVLELVLAAGARLAEPGEFTRRAFLNGRIDLIQAEAVLEIVRAKSEEAIKIASRKLKGEFGKRLSSLRNKLLNLASWVEASLDFPEEDIPLISPEDVEERLKEILIDLNKIIASTKAGSIYREGVRVVICGKPNVGKSSLLNALLQEARAIVTSIPGTTRDLIEEVLNIKGVPIRLVDTAGIRRAKDEIEREGISRSLSQIENADIVLLVLDSSVILEEEDISIIEKLNGKRVIVVYNKKDLPKKIDPAEVRALLPSSKEVWISALYEEGIDQLKEIILMEIQEGMDLSGEVWMTSMRNMEYLERVSSSLKDSIESLRKGLPYDVVSVGIQEALRSIGAITGEEWTEEMLDIIFSQFCIGK
ncbi:MAG: tRNA uridine-5-carboxymethylaminomethyl(34) synthesis GTPase MnmE [Synergistetes bacterium]|nr:tRNA uridine-5-carboxymethylaminomethyl(34) synthesis GTPase MnmE [Synergistota bacterium]MDW8191763.1 tRNA uridine-5-carboxymethylaminomethyl(34) synthesis GTPase MnmE [Synergistota bacterium]